MESLAKLAGIQDASKHMSPATASQHPPPPPIPQTNADIESQTTHSITPKPSRASLPPSRRHSRRSIKESSSHPSLPNTDHPDEAVPPIPQQYTAARQSLESEQVFSNAGDEDEIPWGPQHPCFPHPNPHVPLDSTDYAWTRIIRVQRDWLVAGDLYPALQNMYPEILLDQMSEPEFREVIEKLNTMLRTAFSPWGVRAAVDTVMGVLTGFLWDDAGFTGAKSGVKEIERWTERWNRDRENEGKQVRLVPLRRTAFLSLDIQIPDPGIDGPESDG